MAGLNKRTCKPVSDHFFKVIYVTFMWSFMAKRQRWRTANPLVVGSSSRWCRL